MCIVVWLWEGGTLWRAKWTRRGQKEPHPSITRVDKGGLHNTKLDVPSQTFFFCCFPLLLPTSPRRAHSPQVSRPPPCAAHLERSSEFSFQLKVAAVVGASALKLEQQSRREGEGEGEGERHRGAVAAGRESERSGPLFLCLMRGAVRAQLEGMLRHAPPRRLISLPVACRGGIVSQL